MVLAYLHSKRKRNRKINRGWTSPKSKCLNLFDFLNLFVTCLWLSKNSCFKNEKRTQTSKKELCYFACVYVNVWLCALRFWKFWFSFAKHLTILITVNLWQRCISKWTGYIFNRKFVRLFLFKLWCSITGWKQTQNQNVIQFTFK